MEGNDWVNLVVQLLHCGTTGTPAIAPRLQSGATDQGDSRLNYFGDSR